MRTGARGTVSRQSSHLPIVARSTQLTVVPGCVVPAAQALSSFGVTDITVVVAIAGHTRSQQRAGSPATTFWELFSVVPRSTVLTGVSCGARRTDTELQQQCRLALSGQLDSFPANLHGNVGNSALLQSLAV